MFSLVKKRTKVDTLQLAEYKLNKAKQIPEDNDKQKKLKAKKLKKAEKLMEKGKKEQAIADAR